MTRDEFFNWLTEVCDQAGVEFEERHEFDDGTIWVAFLNIASEED